MSSSPTSEGRRLRGLPLAAKMALVLTLIVAVFMIGFGIFLGGFLESTVRRQIMVAAVAAARTAAQADYDSWTPYFGTVDQGLTPVEVQERVSAMTPFEARAYLGDEARKNRVSWNKARVQRIVSPEGKVVAADLVQFTDGESNGRIVAASYEGEREFQRFMGRDTVTTGDAFAEEGMFSVRGNSRPVIRGVAPLFDADGVQRGELSVFIDSAAVTEAAADFKLAVSWAAMIFVLAGAGVSLLIGRRITRPLKLLQGDIRIVASGDLGHHTRAHSRDEIGELARTFDSMTKDLAEAQELELRAAASQRQETVAAEVAESLVPEALPEIVGYDRAGVHHAAGAMSGEIFDVLPMAAGRFGVLVARASGSGVPATLVMAMARSFLRVVAERETDPGVVLREINGRLSGDLRRGMYVEVVLAVIDPVVGKLTIASAGGAPCFHYHAETESVSVIHSEGIALGFDAGPVFDRTLNVIERDMRPGDRIALVTKGILEVVGSDGKALGEKRLGGLVKREAPTMAESFVGRIDATLVKFHRGNEMENDVTMITLGRLR
ncbi:MAG: serine phosphatase RsbU (regulator of sigma subunit) [Pseudohongiellaceae bacterium]|jgi:serine phosphatase RsbU (regulator of sigma subunit)